MSGDLDSTAEAEAQYHVGCWDALSSLLALMARHQGLDLEDDLARLLRRTEIYHPEREAGRREGFENTVTHFLHVYRTKDNG